MMSGSCRTELRSTDQPFLNKIESLMLCASRSVQALFLCLLYKTVLKSKSREKDTINLHTVKYFTILFPNFTLNNFSTQDFRLFSLPIGFIQILFYISRGLPIADSISLYGMFSIIGVGIGHLSFFKSLAYFFCIRINSEVLFFCT